MEQQAPSSDLESSTAIAILSSYLVISVRVLAYCTGVFFLAVVTPFLYKIVPHPFLGTILLFLFNVAEYEVISRIVEKRYKVTFNTANMNSRDVSYRVMLEKLIHQLGYFFVLDFLLAIIVHGVSGALTQNELLLLIGFFGSVVTLLHYTGVALLIAAFHPKNKTSSGRPNGLVWVSTVLLMPGFLYGCFAIYSSFHHFENIQRFVTLN